MVWLICLSEVVGQIFQAAYFYSFTNAYYRPYDISLLSVGLLYIAPFVGGVLGSSISGKLSDIVCQYMTRRNGGVFEPEFRLVMVVPVAMATVLGVF